MQHLQIHYCADHCFFFLFKTMHIKLLKSASVSTFMASKSVAAISLFGDRRSSPLLGRFHIPTVTGTDAVCINCDWLSRHRLIIKILYLYSTSSTQLAQRAMQI